MCTYNPLPYCLLSAAVSVECTFDTSDLDALPSIMVAMNGLWFGLHLAGDESYRRCERKSCCYG